MMHTPQTEAIGETIDAYYRAICFPPGGKPDWETLKRLFHPAARFLPIDQKTADQASVLDLHGYFQRFHAANEATQRYARGFFEREIERQVTVHQAMAHVWSMYEACHTPADEAPFSRGVCSMQLIYWEQRWVIISLFWQGTTDLTVSIERAPLEQC